MKRLFVLSLLVLVASWPVSAGAEEYRLTYSNFFPPTHIQSILAEEWAAEIEARTDGRVVIDYFPGGTLTPAKDCYDGVTQGLSDIGMSALAYSRGRFPTMAAVDLPLGYTSGMSATHVANALFQQFTPAELDDVHVLYFHAHGPGLLHTAGVAVHTLEDLQGLKLRATGNSGLLVEALGGTPVGMSMPESYQAIQKGVVNGGMYPVETNKGWKMAEVVDYCTESFAVGYTTTFFVVMNNDRWNELPEDIQQIITEVSAEWTDKHGQAWDDSDVEGREYFLELGGEVITLSDEESARWVAAAAPMMDAYVADVTEKGLDGQAILDFTRQTLAAEQQ